MAENKTINKNSPLTLYAQVYEILYSEIDSGTWEPGGTFPTVSELSKRFSVSAITIRRVISDLGTDGLLETSRGTRTRVIEKGSGNNKNILESNIAILFQTNEDVPENFSKKGPWTGAIINAVQDALIEKHYSSTLIPLKGDSDFDNFIDNKTSLFSAIVFVGGRFNPKIMNTFQEKNIPFVMAGRSSADVMNNYVTADYYAGYAAAAETLIEKGADKYIMLMQDSFSGIVSMRGFQETLMSAGVASDSITILRVADIYEASGKKALTEYLKTKKISGTLGIATTGDFLSTGAYKICRKAGLKIPENVLLIGGNVIPNMLENNLSISAIEYPVNEVGEKVVSALFRMIRTSNLTTPGIKIPMTLKLKESTGNSVLR